MRKLNLLFLISVLLIKSVTFAQQYRSDCPVKPDSYTITNPDGSRLTMSVRGSEMVHYFTTSDGYTILPQPDGFYTYGITDINGNLVSSGHVARDQGIKPYPEPQKELKYSSNQLGEIAKEFYSSQTLGKKAGGKPFPSKGNRRVLTLLIDYPNYPSAYPKSNFDSLMMKPNYNNTGSFRDYYQKTSHGQLNLQTDVYGWYRADSNFAYYGKANPSYLSHVGQLIRKAILSADSAGVDFSKYDNDSDGYVDGIIIMHAGYGAEETNAPSAGNHIWSHRYNLSYTGGSVLVDGVLVDSYGIFPEKRYNSGSVSTVGIGVLTHEFGHLLDLPDLYSTQDKGEGAGNFALMAGGGWLNNERTPCLHDAWTRIALGWLQPVMIPAYGTFTIPKCIADSNFAYRINTSLPNEYFLLENRQNKGFDKQIPGKGLAIWHINSNRAKLLSQASNNVNNDTSAYGVGLKQADGRRDLEKNVNRGDAGDLYPGSTNNKVLNSYSNPNSALHYKIGGIRQSSNVVINNISQNSDSSVTFTAGNKPSAGLSVIPPGGCSPLYVNLVNTSAFASGYKWILPNGITDTAKNQSLLFDSAGTYNVKLIIFDTAGLPVDSQSRQIIVSNSPIARYELTRLDSNRFHLVDKSEQAAYISWRFGTSQSSTSPDLIYTLTGNSNIPFSLVAYSLNSCSDTSDGILSYWPLGAKESIAELPLELFPNPFEGALTLRLRLPESNPVRLNLTDIQGREIQYSKEFSGIRGWNEFRIETGQLPEGIYLMQIQSVDFNKTLRVYSR